MDETTKTFFIDSAKTLSPHWTVEEKASALGLYAIENLAVLPELDIGEGEGVPQKEFDREVEEAYEFYRGEALQFLKEMN